LSGQLRIFEDMTRRTTDRRAIQILARSIARELTAEGLQPLQLVALASELITQATERITTGRDATCEEPGDGRSTRA
jgi:hypothetical protein